MEFYKVLLQIMEDRSLSIPDIARSCGLSDSTIRSVINRKQKSVALDVAFKISSGLQVDLEYLNTGKHTAGGECVHTPEPQLVLNSEEADVVKNYRLLDARGRDTVRRCIANQLQYSGKWG